MTFKALKIKEKRNQKKKEKDILETRNEGVESSSLFSSLLIKSRKPCK